MYDDFDSEYDDYGYGPEEYEPSPYNGDDCSDPEFWDDADESPYDYDEPEQYRDDDDYDPYFDE